MVDTVTRGLMSETHDTFFERLQPYFAPSLVRKIELAYMLSKYAHRAQVRKELDEHGDPVRYFEHVRRATLLSIDLAKIVRLDTTIALVLHDWRPYFCKACDRLDNLSSLEQSPVEFRRKQVAETRDKYFRLFDRMVTLTPEEYRDGARRLRDEIHRVTEAVPV